MLLLVILNPVTQKPYFKIMVFKDRSESGKLLAEKLADYKGKENVVFALPRGGVVVGAEIAKKLNSLLDVVIVRKIGHPLQPEFGIAAVSEKGHLVKNEKYLATVDENWFAGEIERQKTAAQHRRNLYQPAIKETHVENKNAILVDDGVATGLTTKAAISDLKDRRPKKIILAVPVILKQLADEIRPTVDRLIALEESAEFLGAVGAYYENFPQISDEEVIKILKALNNLINKHE